MGSVRVKRAVIGFAIPIALLAVIWFLNFPLMRGIANVWVVSGSKGPGDAAVILGGGLDTRPFEAFDLFSAGLVRKVLVSNVVSQRSVDIGAVPGHTELNIRVLQKLGVPDSAIETFGYNNNSTADEAESLRQWANGHAVSVLIIPVEPFFTRRAQWLFDRAFSGSGVTIKVYPLKSKQTQGQWWKSRAAVIGFQNEILKYLYYRLTY